jgi:hypothetical protein
VTTGGVLLIQTEFAAASILMFGAALLIVFSTLNVLHYIDDKDDEINSLESLNKRLTQEILEYDEMTENMCDEVQNQDTDQEDLTGEGNVTDEEVEWFKKHVTAKANNQVMTAMITPKKRKFTNYVKSNTDNESEESEGSEEFEDSDKKTN